MRLATSQNPTKSTGFVTHKKPQRPSKSIIMKIYQNT